jgi:tetratricopeptide (TPR) repeat protein
MRLALILALLLAVAPCLAQQAAPKPPPDAQERIRQALEWNKEGMDLYAKGKVGSAAEDFGKVYAWFPDNPDVAFNYGMALTSLGQFETAIPPLQKAVAGRPSDGAAHMNLGICYIGLGRTEDGVAELQKTIQTDPKNAEALFQLALAYHKLNQPDKAAESLRWLSERNADSPKIHLYIGRALRIAKSFPEAEKEIDKALALDPHFAEAQFELGVIQRAEGHAEDAEKSFKEALRLHPEVPKYNQGLAQLYLMQFHDVDKALPYFKTVVEFNPDNAMAEVDLGDAYLKKGDIPDAEKALRHAIELDAKVSRPHFLLGTLLRRQGKKEESAKEFAAAQALAEKEHDRTKAAGDSAGNVP